MSFVNCYVIIDYALVKFLLFASRVYAFILYVRIDLIDGAFTSREMKMNRRVRVAFYGAENFSKILSIYSVR